MTITSIIWKERKDKGRMVQPTSLFSFLYLLFCCGLFIFKATECLLQVNFLISIIPNKSFLFSVLSRGHCFKARKRRCLQFPTALHLPVLKVSLFQPRRPSFLSLNLCLSQRARQSKVVHSWPEVGRIHRERRLGDKVKYKSWARLSTCCSKLYRPCLEDWGSKESLEHGQIWASGYI